MTSPPETITINGKPITISTDHRKPYSPSMPETLADVGPAWSGDREGPAFFTELYQAS